MNNSSHWVSKQNKQGNKQTKKKKPCSFSAKFYQTFKDWRISIILKSIHKIKTEITFLNSFYEATLTHNTQTTSFRWKRYYQCNSIKNRSPWRLSSSCSFSLESVIQVLLKEALHDMHAPFPSLFSTLPFRGHRRKMLSWCRGQLSQENPLTPSVRLSRPQSCEGQNVYYLKKKKSRKKLCFLIFMSLDRN